jgi:thioesterase domain-containing protein
MGTDVASVASSAAEDATAATQAVGTVHGGAGVARVVELKPGQPGPCVFLVPGTGGKIEGFADLACSLQTPMPVFAIEARGVEGSSSPDTNIEEMARHYVTRVRSIQPSGPYFFAGHSFGGVVAYEMAQQLVRANETVACLIMLDTPVSEKYWPLPFYLRNLWTRGLRHFKRVLTVSPVENIRYYFRRLLLRRYGLERIPSDILIGSNVARVMIASEIARHAYHPAFFPGKLTFFRSSEAIGFEDLWRHRVAALEVRSADGGHIKMIEPPFVARLAYEISECLAKAV